ncbi:MAG: ammonium transporter Amt [Prolixibacteraceae bacterium]|nr:MAG: ammonium transporter Amt [Prolixibacteraceae bacterium]
MKSTVRWWIILVLLIIVAFLGVIVPTGTGEQDLSKIDPGDTAWMLTATGLVLLMTPGLAFFYGGMVHPKNIISTMMQSYIAMGIVSVLWVVVGFSIAFGESIGSGGFGLFGNPLTYFMFRGVGAGTHPDLAPTFPLAVFAMFQLKFAIITPALITGSFAGRVRFRAYMLFISLFVIFVYAPLAHWTWHPNGFLRNWGVLDFAGGTVVHMSAGFAALTGALFLGRRKELKEFKPANIPYILLSAGMLWFGWFGFSRFGPGCQRGSRFCTGKYKYCIGSRNANLDFLRCCKREKTIGCGLCHRIGCWIGCHYAGCRFCKCGVKHFYWRDSSNCKQLCHYAQNQIHTR